MNVKLHAVTDAEGRPVRFYMTAGQASDHIGAAALLSSLPRAEWLLADRGYDADWFRDALKDKEIKPCIPSRKSRSKSIKHDKRRYKRRNRIKIMFGRLKDWRRVSPRLRQMPQGFPLSHRSRRNRHVLAIKREQVLTLDCRRTSEALPGLLSPLHRDRSAVPKPARPPPVNPAQAWPIAIATPRR
jgi:transposase